MRSNKQTNEAGPEKSSGIEKLPQPENCNISKTIAVMSGKGGVGKSTVSALLAVSLAQQGFRVGLLDADITGPSIPKLFGMHQKAKSVDGRIEPSVSKLGIKVMSLNLLLAQEDDPVIWRGPLIGGAVKQFWSDVLWGELDYLVVDLPPGTGDAPLTVLQSLPLDGLVIVSSPQDLAVMVVRKAIKMAKMMNVPIIGLVENMSGMVCPHCGETIEMFGKSKADEVVAATDIELLGRLPLDPKLSELGDKGAIEDYPVEIFSDLPSKINEVNLKTG
ncbi:MAG: Mrp/NBP35 family ATP-binding protein [Bacillota bacterium]